MKKFFLTIMAAGLCMSLSHTAKAQDFEKKYKLPKGTEAVAYNIDEYTSVKLVVENITQEDILMAYDILENTAYDISDRWTVNFCDFDECHTGSWPQSDTDKVKVGIPAVMSMDVEPFDQKGSAKIVCRIFEVTNPTVFDIVKFEVSTYAGVKTVRRIDNDIEVFPVPATNRLNIYTPAQRAAASVKIFNTAGQLMAAYAETGTTLNLNIEMLPAGLYTVAITDNQGFVSTRKFSKQ